MTVGAIGIMSEDHHLYSALPALILGQCGRESGHEHAAVIQTTLDGVAKSGLQTISITSEGESHWGKALIHLTFKKHLEKSSPIYPALSVLPLMNLEVGDNDITADKYYKHIFKHCRNLLLREWGTKVHGMNILPSMLQSQLRQNNVPASQISNLLKPNDKQDIKLAYNLLSQIWALPSLNPRMPLHDQDLQRHEKYSILLEGSLWTYSSLMSALSYLFPSSLPSSVLQLICYLW